MIQELIGKTLVEIKGGKGDDHLTFITTGGEVYEMYHEQDCCEGVDLDDIVGDLNDLIGSPIVEAYESQGDDPPKSSWEDSYTWTFYRLATIKGTVTLKWYGSSNGYYSEGVTFKKVQGYVN